MRVDAHQHFWRPERGDYPWMPDAPEALQRPFGPAELAPFLVASNIDATVLVQAAPTVGETHYLLGMADATPWVLGVVGWIDFERADQRAHLDTLATHPKLVGIRPMVQDIADDDWVLRDSIDWAFDAIAELDLCFDALGHARHARRFLARCVRHPDVRVVIDHGCKPEIASDGFATWAKDMRDIAQNSSAMCKLSGLATEAGSDPSLARLRPYIEHLLECFGAPRLIWGSDWPVATTAISYTAWLQLCERVLKPLSSEERAAVFGLNAIHAYRIGSATHAGLEVSA